MTPPEPISSVIARVMERLIRKRAVVQTHQKVNQIIEKTQEQNTNG